MGTCHACGARLEKGDEFCRKCGESQSGNGIHMKERARDLPQTRITALSLLVFFVCLSSFFYYEGQQEIESLQEQVSVLKTQITGLDKQIGQKDATILQNDEELKSKNEMIATQQQQISDLQHTAANLRTELEEKKQQIEAQKRQIESLNLQVQSLGQQLGETKEELEETTRLLNIAKDYEERVISGIDLSKAYRLLGDYDKTVDIVANITGVSAPATDKDLWVRGREIYDWLGPHYSYCSDKGLCISNEQCTQIQFFSPDELLYYGSQDVLCGDCDDQAQLFAGMLYASGVSHDKVRVECGSVPGGGHCWNGIYIDGAWYRIDPVCSNPTSYVLERFGLSFLSKSSYPANDYRNVDCFGDYETYNWYNPEGYTTVK